MAFGRKKGSPQIDSFGPVDTLLAASGTLEGAQRDYLLKALTSEEYVEAAVESAGTLSRDETARIEHVCRVGYASAMEIAKLKQPSFITELRAARVLLAGCLQQPPDEVVLTDHIEGFAFALASIKGGSRMFQLKRDEQAMAAIALGMLLVQFALLDDANDTVVYVATWGRNGQNKCTFFVQPDLSISWTPETDEPELLEEHSAIAALSELEYALGKKASFPDHLNGISDLAQSFIDSGKATLSTESFFTWNPPLPDDAPNGVD